ncbi:Interferon alpha-inducible protein 27, mitochondrial [Balamuthia mandrillaris]
MDDRRLHGLPKLDEKEDTPVAPPQVVAPGQAAAVSPSLGKDPPTTNKEETDEEGGSSQWPVGAAVLGAAGGGVAAGVAAPACVSAAVGAAGFGSAGVTAGSFAAAIQGSSVASGGLFAACQSIGATGSLAYLGSAGLLVVGGAALIGAAAVGTGIYVGANLLASRGEPRHTSAVTTNEGDGERDDADEAEEDEDEEQEEELEEAPQQQLLREPLDGEQSNMQELSTLSERSSCIRLAEVDVERALLIQQDISHKDGSGYSWMTVTASMLAPVMGQVLKTVNTAKCFEMVLRGDLLEGIATGAMRLSKTGEYFNGLVMKSDGIAGNALWKPVSITGSLACLALSTFAMGFSLYQQHKLQCKLDEQAAVIAEMNRSQLQSKLAKLQTVRSRICELVKMVHLMRHTQFDRSQFVKEYEKLRDRLIDLFHFFGMKLDDMIASDDKPKVMYIFDVLQMIVLLYSALQFIRVYFERLCQPDKNEEEEDASTSFLQYETDLREQLHSRLLQLERLAQSHQPPTALSLKLLPSKRKEEEEVKKFNAWLQHKRKTKNKKTHKLPLIISYDPDSSSSTRPQLSFFPSDSSSSSSAAAASSSSSL